MSMLDEIRRFSGEAFQFVSTKQANAMKAALPRARQFLFDDQASRYMAHFVQDCADLILQNEQFAIPQFPVTYIEFNIEAFLQELGRPVSGLTEETKDGSVGYLIVDNVIYCMTKGLGKRAKASVMHYGYSIGRDPKQKILGRLLLSRRRKAQYFLGSTFESATMEQFQEIADKYEILNFTNLDDDFLLKTIITNATGDIRNLIMMILFLYQKQDVTTINDFGPSRRFLAGKSITYMSHSVVSINLRDTKNIRKKFHVVGQTHNTKRRHEVKPYYRTVPAKNGCDHEFEPVLDREDKWHCKKCGAYRWRIHDYWRGDATKGFVKKHYEVTA